MEIRRVGTSGLVVSAVGLGTLTWGRDTDEVDAGEQLREFADAGGILLDTAASYGEGAAEELLGSLLASVGEREDFTICTKAGVRRRGDGMALEISRGNLLTTLDASLKRLRTDYVDLWLVQSVSLDVPEEEVLSALRIAVESGRARYVGLSNAPAWYAARAATLLSGAGIGLAGLEMEYSLLQRGVEREVAPACERLGMGMLAWSPLGRGVLTGKYRRSVPADSRGASPHLSGFVRPYLTTSAAAVVEAVATAAEGLGKAPVEVALAWAAGAPGVSSAIVGARTGAQLRGSLPGADLELPDAIRAALDEVSGIDVGYPERPVTG